MPPRVPITRFARSTCRKPATFTQPLCLRLQPRRLVSSDEKPLPTKDDAGPGPNQDQLPHVSEEAAAIDKAMGKQPPEVDQGTNVQEVLNRDPAAKDNKPQVLKDKNKPSNTAGSRSYSTSARNLSELASFSSPTQTMEPQFNASLLGGALAPGKVQPQAVRKQVPGIKFEVPMLPIPKDEIMKHRYDPIVKQVTMLLVKDGKLARAQTNMMRILNHLRTSPPPVPSAKHPLLPGAPPAAHLPLNPILYLTLALDSVAPIIRMKSLKGLAGGGQALQIPMPLGIQRRRRTAVMWILDICEKKVASGSGKDMFARKFAGEIISIVEGKSGVWAKREAVHKLGVAARSNLTKLAQIQARR